MIFTSPSVEAGFPIPPLQAVEPPEPLEPLELPSPALWYPHWIRLYYIILYYIIFIITLCLLSYWIKHVYVYYYYHCVYIRLYTQYVRFCCDYSIIIIIIVIIVQYDILQHMTVYHGILGMMSPPSLGFSIHGG